MLFLKELIEGTKVYFHANRVIFRYRLWPYLFVPGLLSMAFVLMLIIAGAAYFDDFSSYINDHWVPAFMQGGAMVVITAILLWILLILIGYMTYKHLVLIVFSPFLGYLSEKTESLVYKQAAPDFSALQLFKDLLRGLIINLRNLAYSVMFMIPAWLLIFIPVIGAFASVVLLFYIQSYYGGFGLVDYTLERKRYSVRESIRFMQRNRGRVTGVGAGFMLLLFIPLIGWFAAPAYGTVAATLVTVEKIHADKVRKFGESRNRLSRRDNGNG